MIQRLLERLSRLGEALTWPIERAFAVTVQKLFHAESGLESVEVWLVGLARLLLWPFVTAWRLLAAFGRMLVPTAVREGFSGMGSRAARQLVAAAEWLNLDRPIRWGVWLTQPLWRPVAAVIGFAHVWLTTRPYRQMLWGLPAILLLAPICAAAAWGVLLGRGKVMTNYRLAFKEAQEAGDLDRMQLFERKLSQLGDRTEQTSYNAALELAEQGDVDEAYRRMQRLAPSEKAGYLPAHFWILQKLVRKELPESASERSRLIGMHLDRLDEARVRAPELALLRAGWLTETGELDEAAELLKPMVHLSPAAAVQRMALNASRGDNAEARKDASAVKTHYRERDRKEIAVSAEEYRWWYVAEEITEDPGGQAAVARAWRRTYPDDELARQAMSNVLQSESAALLAGGEVDVNRLVAQIEEVARLEADPRQLQQLVSALLRDRSKSTTAKAAVEALETAADTPGAILQVIGTTYLIEGDVQKAEQLLKRAVDANPQDAVSWNNYACALVASPNGDLTAALAASERALQLTPDRAQFHETHGQVLVRLQRWEPAIAELELAMNGMPDSKEIHRSLAIAYAATNQPELAEVHRQQSQ